MSPTEHKRQLVCRALDALMADSAKNNKAENPREGPRTVAQTIAVIEKALGPDAARQIKQLTLYDVLLSLDVETLLNLIGVEAGGK